MQNFHDDPDARQKNEAFEVGMRVKVISPMVDFYAFRGETGTVESNSGGYLGIIVRFDKPRRFKDGHVQEWFNFNYYDLELLLTPVDADEYARVCAEAADLRRQLAEAQAKLSELRPVVEQALYLAIDDIAERINTDMTVEASDLRRQLAAAQAWGELQAALVAAVPIDAIDDLYTAYAYATAGSEVHARFPVVGRWLGKLPEVQP